MKRYRYGAKLGGVIYLRRIPDPRSDASSFGRFRKCCSDRRWENVVIATNVWQSETGLAQKQDLASDNKMFKPALNNDPMLFKLYNTTESAHQLLQQMIKARPDILQPILLTIAYVNLFKI